jgi:hypothetical protein
MKTLFLVSPIGDDGSDVRIRANLIMRHLIEPAVRLASHEYDLVRADTISQPGNISNDVIRYLFKSEIVIADLTNHNPNVTYEVAIRHARKKPCILLSTTSKDIPFDIAPERTITIPQDLMDRDARRLCFEELLQADH